jgi:hypothetical protein
VQTKDSSGNVLWDSSWRQAIINNIIPANQFTSGSSGQFTYDVTTGADGVTPPYAVAYSPPGVVDVNFGTLDSNGEGKTISNLNLMDPTNTFLLGGGMLTGAIYYYTGLVSDPELGISYQDGGGRHIPGVVITSESSVNITMFRLGDGPISASAGEYCTRVATSHHPEGAFVLARIT